MLHNRSVDESEALTMPGVHGFVCAKDVPGKIKIGPIAQDEEVFATDEVKAYWNHRKPFHLTVGFTHRVSTSEDKTGLSDSELYKTRDSAVVFTLLESPSN